MEILFSAVQFGYYKYYTFIGSCKQSTVSSSIVHVYPNYVGRVRRVKLRAHRETRECNPDSQRSGSLHTLRVRTVELCLLERVSGARLESACLKKIQRVEICMLERVSGERLESPCLKRIKRRTLQLHARRVSSICELQKTPVLCTPIRPDQMKYLSIINI
jgi:hypothetical protein